MRINKYLAHLGVCSRREADALIKGGHVSLNSRGAQLGDIVVPGDQIRINGRLVEATDHEYVYLIYNKPSGVICTTDESIPDNIISAIGYKSRIFPVGRLDVTSRGLILLTNNGDAAQRLLRAEFRCEKEYEVRIDKPLTQEFLESMANGVLLKTGRRTLPAGVTALTDKQFTIVLRQGLNRQIHRMCEALDCSVRSIKRVRIANLLLPPDLQPGQWRELEARQLDHFLAAIGVGKTSRTLDSKMNTDPAPPAATSPGSKQRSRR